MSKSLLVIGAFIVWLAASTYYYDCNIKRVCTSENVALQIPAEVKPVVEATPKEVVAVLPTPPATAELALASAPPAAVAVAEVVVVKSTGPVSLSAPSQPLSTPSVASAPVPAAPVPAASVAQPAPTPTFTPTPALSQTPGPTPTIANALTAAPAPVVFPSRMPQSAGAAAAATVLPAPAPAPVSAPASVPAVSEKMASQKVVMPSTAVSSGAIQSLPILFPMRKAIRHPNVRVDGHLQRVVAHLKSGGRAMVIGFTDNRGVNENNLLLAKERAESIRAELTNLGAPAEKIEVSAKGESNPASENDTVMGRQRNRRVEIMTQ